MPSFPASAPRTAVLACVLALLLLAHLRIGEILAPASGRYPGVGDPSWRINATQTLQLTRNWHRFGLAKNRFLPHFLRPRAEEPYPTSPYVSYPPGFVLLPWLSARATGTAPELEHITAWGRLFHFFSAALVAAIAWGLWLKKGAAMAGAAALAAACGLLALHVPLLAVYFPFAWWADAAGLPCFLMLVTLQLFLPATTPARRALHAAVITCGVLTDWLFFLLVAALIVRDLASRPRRLRPELFALPAAYVALHLLLVWNAGLLDDLWAKVAFRSGIERQELSLLAGLRSWWAGYAREAGTPMAWLTLAALLLTPFLAAAFLRRCRQGREPALWLEAAYLLCVPALLHFVLLHQHYYDHPYEGMKLVLITSLFWLGLAPAALLGHLKKAPARAALAACAVVAGTALASGYPATLRELVSRRIDLAPASEEFCKAVFRAADYPDIHFSPHFATADPLGEGKPDPRVDSWAYVPCNGHVYLAGRPTDVFDLYARQGWKTRLSGGPFRLLLWTRGKPGREWAKALVPGSERVFGGIQVQELSRSLLR